jgi:hypothetical protein
MSQKPELLTSGQTYNGEWDSARFDPAAGGRSVHVVSAMFPIWEQTFFGGGFCIFLERDSFLLEVRFLFFGEYEELSLAWWTAVVQSISRVASGDTGLRP